MEAKPCTLKRPVGLAPPEAFRRYKPTKVFTSTCQVLDKSSLKQNGRVILVGDIHGCHAEFMELLDKCDYRENQDNLILLGDLVAKGPDSIEVLSEAIRLGALAVRGNHDHGALIAFNELCKNREVKNVWKWVQDMTPEHARDHPTIPRIGTKNRERGKSWQQLWKGPHHVLHGHAARDAAQFSPFATCVDTGCVYGNSLSACILPCPSDVQSKFRVRNLNSLNAAMVSVKARKAYQDW